MSCTREIWNSNKLLYKGAHGIILGVGQLIHNLFGNLTAIRAVLKDAEDKQITSHAVKDWLQKLTDAAHVLDDILDECSIESKLHGNNNCLTSLHPKNILARRNLGKRMKEIVERFNVIAEERNKFELRGGIMETHQEDHDEWRKTSSAITEPKVYGRDQDIEQVVEFLLRHTRDSEELSVYSIVGLGGLGKTTLAQVVFNDERNQCKERSKKCCKAKKAFASLKKLTLLGLPNLERVLEAEGVEMLPLLSELTIEGVPKLVLPSLPSLEYLSTRGSNETNEGFLKGIECSMHRLKKLKIENFDKLKVLPDELGTLSALEELEIFFCDELESFPEHVIQSLRSLRTLMIFFCPKFKSLSEGMGHLTCLEDLQIGGCPQLVALPNNMNQLTNLRKVRFLGKSKDSRLPEGLERIPSLQSLSLTEFPSLTSFPDWLGAMTSLEQLEISDCPELRSLPDSFQQLKNLHELSIDRCPKLETSCKKGTGKDWQKIAHVPEFYLATEPTFCEKIISAWKMRKQIMNSHRYVYTSEDEFNSMVDVF